MTITLRRAEREANLVCLSVNQIRKKYRKKDYDAQGLLRIDVNPSQGQPKTPSAARRRLWRDATHLLRGD